HPFNKNSTLPHFDDPSEESLVAYLTASRSMAFTLGDHIFTLKMATNYPHGPNGARSREKATTKEDVMDGINRMSYIERVDKEIGQDPELILAKEVAIVVDKATGEGYLVRDLSFMNDGNYYLPALSIPYIGRKIAELNRMSPEAFWAKHYAALLGKSKAKLLLRYGLQMETPNPQNIFIQLDSNLRPTGVLVFRDLSDTILIEGVAKGLGEEETLKKDADVGVENGHKIRPYWPNSAWGFSEGGNSFSQLTLDRWRIIHDNAYKQEIEQTLGVDLSQFANIDDNIKFNLLMRSEVFQKKLGEYREELKKKERARHARGEAS
ncbi:MAG TPA: hypothetical protein VN132_09050, partial [Bdellovibrio sp.]|nr:hypothetical protein [Bdellovibrio sp.]